MQDIDRKRLAISRRAVTAAALAMPLVPAKGRAASAEPVKIGWLPSLTGPLATAAIGFDHGVSFGVEQANKAGGIDGRPIELAADGSFWFTDCGRVHRYHEDRGAVYWARPDGSEIRLVASPLEKPNEIGLSPDGTTLFVAETTTARLWAYDILGPGVLRCLDRGAPFAVRRCVAGLPGSQLLELARGPGERRCVRGDDPPGRDDFLPRRRCAYATGDAGRDTDEHLFRRRRSEASLGHADLDRPTLCGALGAGRSSARIRAIVPTSRHGPRTGQAPEDRLRPAIHDFLARSSKVVDGPPEPVLGPLTRARAMTG